VSLDTTIALITFEEYCTFAGLKKSNDKLDQDRFELFIHQASQEIINECGRKFIEPSSQVEEVFDGDGTGEYFIKNCRWASGDTPVIYYWDGTQYVEMTAANFPRAYVQESGKVYFTKGNIFTHRRYKIAHKYGWTQANIPYDLKELCAVMVQRALKRADKHEGVTSEGMSDSTTAFNLHKITESMQTIINHYCRGHSFG